MTKVRQWLHTHGIHRLCRSRRVVDRVLPGFDEWLPGIEGAEPIDITNHSGPRTVYKTVHY